MFEMMFGIGLLMKFFMLMFVVMLVDDEVLLFDLFVMEFFFEFGLD